MQDVHKDFNKICISYIFFELKLYLCRVYNNIIIDIVVLHPRMFAYCCKFSQRGIYCISIPIICV